MLVAIFGLLAIAIGGLLLRLVTDGWLSLFFFVYQDGLFCIPLVAALAVQPEQKKEAGISPKFFREPAVVVAVAIALVAVCWGGHYAVLLGHDLSRDEQMANFDAYIFGHGRLFWPIPSAWRPFAPALNQGFILPIGNHEAWVSAYLPINAAIRALVGVVADPALTSPILVAAGFLALWRVSLRLWPDSLSTRVAVLLLYVGSAQVIITGMTAYAMTGHLALDLIWLALFLEDRKASHFGAVAVGFLATGLHQPLFHPMFVLPFTGLLVARRRWNLLAFYGASYAFIGAFWFLWPIWVSSHGVGPIVTNGGRGISYLTRLLNVVKPPTVDSLWLTALNLLRFGTWQHLLLLPLLAVGVRFAWKQDPLARTLAIGFILPIPVMLVMLPYQGHGWGYRYLHGVIGNACLLGGYGWRALDRQGLSFKQALIWTTAATLFLVLPIRAFMANRMTRAFIQPDQIIARSGADIAVVEDDAAPFDRDIVINKPDLTNHPIRLAMSDLSPSDIAHLCTKASIAFVGAPNLQSIDHFFGRGRRPTSPWMKRLERTAQSSGCNVQPVNAVHLSPQ